MELRTRPLFEIKGMVNWNNMKDKILSTKNNLELLNQHYTTTTKLGIAAHHFTKLSKIIPNQKATDLMKISKNEVEFNDFYKKKCEDYFGELDGFFYSLRSCIDSFLWEINYSFKLGCLRATHTWNEMKKKHPKKKITKILNDLNKESWFTYLNYIRNNITHYSLSEIVTFTEDFKLYLPEKPETASYSRKKEFEVMPRLNQLLENTKEFLEKGYDSLIEELTS